MLRKLSLALFVTFACSGSLLLSGCDGMSGSIPGGGNGGGDNGGSGGGGGDGGTGGDNNGGTGGDGSVGDDGEPVTGNYVPSSDFMLETEGLTLFIPAGATLTATPVTMLAASEVASPGAIPGAVDLAGGEFGPSGLQFLTSVEVTATLLSPTIATVLPVITFNDSSKRWVGTGDLGAVSADGSEVTFPLDHFSIAGVPDPVPFPLSGESIPSLLTIPNTGTFLSTEISSETVSLTYSDAIGGSLEIDVSSEQVNDQGQPQVLFMHLSATSITVVDGFVIATIGGQGSVFDTGDFRSSDESLVGTVVLSLSGSTVSATVFVASTSRVLFGTLTGEAG